MKRLLPTVASLALLAAGLPLSAASQDSRSGASRTREVVAAARALPETIELSGVFEPAEVVEVKIDLETYAEGLKIKQVAAHGQQVKQGEVLLAVDPEPVQRALASAANKKAVADVNLRKAETDSQIGEQSDALAARVAQRQLANAEQALSWFEGVDGEALLKNAEMMVERAQDGIEDQEEEIAQLQKMYQSEELTEDTADIVVKRALRQLRYAKEMLDLTKKRADKMKEKDYADQKQNLIDALDTQRLAIQQLENDQAARKANREAALIAAQEAARQATQAHEKLQADAGKLSVAAPAEGFVYYGQLSGGAWANASADALKPDTEIKPDQPVMTFFRPGAMKIKVDLPEKDRFRLLTDKPVKVSPVALPEVSVEGKIVGVSPLALQKGPNRVFEVTVELASVDPRVAPGFGAKVEVPANGQAYPMVPADYVKDGKLRVKQGQEVVTVDVKTGKTDGNFVQVTEGLRAGATVLPPEQPPASGGAAGNGEAPGSRGAKR